MLSDHKFIKMKDGAELHAEIKEKGRPVWMVAIHGLSEHLGRHQYVQDLFGYDFNICQFDLRGHGRSSGPRAYIEDFQQYLEDFKEVLHFLRETYQMERFVLFGHSMGALIAADYLQNHADNSFYPERMLINAPPVGLSGVMGKVVNAIPHEAMSTLAKIPMSIRLGGMVDTNFLSHDPHVKKAYLEDELNTPRVHTKLLLELVKDSKNVFSRPIRPKCPSFCSYGTDDLVIGPEHIKEYFETTEKAFSVRPFEGAYHEAHNEIEKYRKPYFDYLKEVFNEVLYSS